jgi:hypothetical protein
VPMFVPDVLTMARKLLIVIGLNRGRLGIRMERRDREDFKAFGTSSSSGVSS